MAVYEQLIDAIVGRNLDVLPSALLGSPGRFLFNSSDYWGPLDVCCVLADGRIAAFENKAKRPTKKDLDKFCRDVSTLATKGRAYLEHRFQHAVDKLVVHRAAAERMFAGYFLNQRSETTPYGRDLVHEACTVLGISHDEFQRLFRSGNGWLDALADRPVFDDYMAEFSSELDWKRVVPILLVPDCSLSTVNQWIVENETNHRLFAHVVRYNLFQEHAGYPDRLEVELLGTCPI